MIYNRDRKVVKVIGKFHTEIMSKLHINLHKNAWQLMFCYTYSGN